MLKSVDETQCTLILVFRLHILTELSKETSVKCIQTGDYPSLNRGNVVYCYSIRGFFFFWFCSFL